MVRIRWIRFMNTSVCRKSPTTCTIGQWPIFTIGFGDGMSGEPRVESGKRRAGREEYGAETTEILRRLRMTQPETKTTIHHPDIGDERDPGKNRGRHRHGAHRAGCALSRNRRTASGRKPAHDNGMASGALATTSQGRIVCRIVTLPGGEHSGINCV